MVLQGHTIADAVQWALTSGNLPEDTQTVLKAALAEAGNPFPGEHTSVCELMTTSSANE